MGVLRTQKKDTTQRGVTVKNILYSIRPSSSQTVFFFLKKRTIINTCISLRALGVMWCCTDGLDRGIKELGVRGAWLVLITPITIHSSTG